MKPPIYRYLRGYSLDPGFSTRLDTAGINEVLYQVPFEEVQPGPCGEYLEVVDFDPPSGCWYEPVDLSHESVASQQGLTPSEGNPQFHQQFVYAVAMKTIRHFERALGRKIIWYPRLTRTRSAGGRVQIRRDYVQQLRIHPHALRDANAYYDPDKTALLFGYFDAAEQYYGRNYPGGLVFTCLSPDIVAHEMTHAILDSIHHRYIEDTNPDVAAFHEGFADIVALLQRFTFRALVEDRLYAAGGRMDQQAFVLGELATQFGEALRGNRGALRNMIGREDAEGNWRPLVPSPADYVNAVEAHDRGAVLVATIFDAFQRIYAFRTRDLLRIATNGTGVLPEGSISRDLVGRLASEAAEIAEHLLHICIRALDYSPPNDITFGSYLRALITADVDIAPEDENGYRVALIEAFRARGIFPEPRQHPVGREPAVAGAAVLEGRGKGARLHRARASEPHPPARRDRRPAPGRRDFERGPGQAAQMADRQAERARCSRLGAASQQARADVPARLRAVRQASRDVKFLRRTELPPIEVHTVRPAFRGGREGRQIEQVVVTLTQRVDTDLGSGNSVRPMVFRGGCSLILSFGNLNRVEYVIVKNIKSYDRYQEQVDYMNGDTGTPLAVSPYADDERPARLQFDLLHQYRG